MTQQPIRSLFTASEEHVAHYEAIMEAVVGLRWDEDERAWFTTNNTDTPNSLVAFKIELKWRQPRERLFSCKHRVYLVTDGKRYAETNGRWLKDLWGGTGRTRLGQRAKAAIEEAIREYMTQ